MAQKGSKKTAKKAKRHYPVQRQMRLGDLTAAAGVARVIQSTRCLGNANRRLYRQSYVYNLKIDVDIGSALATAGVDVYVLRDTWDLHGAYKEAMKQYYNAMREELGTPNVDTRWHDFRVSSDLLADEMVPVTFNPQASVPLFNADQLTDGDHDLSQVVTSAGVTKTFVLDDAATASQFSIIQEWQKRDQVDVKDTGLSAFQPYTGIVEDYDSANHVILADNGRVPPYNDQSDLSLWHKVTTLKQVSPDGVMKLSSGFIEAPLGLVILVSSGFTTDLTADRGVTLTFQSGDYKGVKATRYATPVLTDSMEYEVV